jgi:hypothetical protein
MSQVFSVADTRERAQAAFAAGKTINDCPYNWHAAAYGVWRAEFVRLQNAAKASPQSHIAPAPVLRVDEAQSC